MGRKQVKPTLHAFCLKCLPFLETVMLLLSFHLEAARLTSYRLSNRLYRGRCRAWNFNENIDSLTSIGEAPNAHVRNICMEHIMKQIKQRNETALLTAEGLHAQGRRASMSYCSYGNLG